jgi:hypothetical protein
MTANFIDQDMAHRSGATIVQLLGERPTPPRLWKRYFFDGPGYVRFPSRHQIGCGLHKLNRRMLYARKYQQNGMIDRAWVMGSRPAFSCVPRSKLARQY